MPKFKRPSPAFVLAFVALLVALTGSAVAGVPARIARAISGSSIKNHSIRGYKLRDNTLTGRQIVESKLGVVPRAHHAGAATTAGTAFNSGSVGGVHVHRIIYAPGRGTNPATILSVQGMNIIASCSGAGVVGLRATSGVNDSDVRVAVVQSTQTRNGTDATRTAADSNFDFGHTVDMTAGATRGTGALNFVRPDGHTAQIQYTFHNSPSLGATQRCLVSGMSFDG